MPLGVGAKIGALAAGKDAPSKLQKYVRYGSMVIASPLGDYETSCCAMLRNLPSQQFGHIANLRNRSNNGFSAFP
jgi:hypothetical protein